MHVCVCVYIFIYIIVHYNINAESKLSSLVKVYYKLLKQNDHTQLEITDIV